MRGYVLHGVFLKIWIADAALPAVMNYPQLSWRTLLSSSSQRALRRPFLRLSTAHSSTPLYPETSGSRRPWSGRSGWWGLQWPASPLFLYPGSLGRPVRRFRICWFAWAGSARSSINKIQSVLKFTKKRWRAIIPTVKTVGFLARKGYSQIIVLI